MNNMPTWEQISPILDDAIDGLELEDRIIVVLLLLERASLEEVQTALRCSVSAARSRIECALKRLCAALELRGAVVGIEELFSMASRPLIVASKGLAALLANEALADARAHPFGNS